MDVINAIGLKEIHDFLCRFHVRGDSDFVLAIALTYADMANDRLRVGARPTIELAEHHSITGMPEVFEVSPRGVKNLPSMFCD